MSDNPFYIRYNNQKPVINHSGDFEIGKAEIISEGRGCNNFGIQDFIASGI